MLKRFLAVIISTIIVSLGISLLNYVPLGQRESDVYYFGIGEYFLFASYIFFIFYVVIGLPISWLLDKYRKRLRTKPVVIQYCIGVLVYSLMGLLLGTVYHFALGSIQFNLNIFIETLGYWFTAAFCYFHVLWIFERRTIKKSQTSSLG
ncbi:hypothetical protein [Planococcus donghaensis]|uniref:Uncharacterized protein n=1 Tax=Planococcus donghaensis TaxID=414778 RepID=A0A1C7EI84_9BACL|nr:hypothetical protein [Planococcus donghaensis]ANU23366.1 hypothetical protein BCM40_08265 [Planococcus donghaensis]